MSKIWIVADVKSADGRVWELLGVFDSETLADDACTEWNHAYWPWEINRRAPDESTIASDVRYPRATTSQSPPDQ